MRDGEAHPMGVAAFHPLSNSVIRGECVTFLHVRRRPIVVRRVRDDEQTKLSCHPDSPRPTIYSETKLYSVDP